MKYPPELQAKIEAVVASHRESQNLPAAVNERPRFTYHPNATPEVGQIIQVYCSSAPFPKGGMVEEQVGCAWMIAVEGHSLVVHDSEDAWWDP